MQDDDDFLGDLKRAYAAALPERLGRILAAARDTRPPHEDLLGELHRLAGSAGSVGFAEVGDAARAWEQALRSGRDDRLERAAFERVAAAHGGRC